MALTRSEQFTSPAAGDEVAQRFEAWHAVNGGRFEKAPDGSLVGKTGKKVAVRILGAFFVPRAWWPLRTELRLAPAASGTNVDMTVADDFGVGIRTGMKGKYDELMATRAAEIKDAVS